MRSRKYNDQRQIIIAASDTALQIVSPTKRFFEIVDPLVGVATLFCMVLPDARTIRIGTPFVFENPSSNFVGIYNADRSTFHRLMPRGTLRVTLRSQATASGVWFSAVNDPAVANPAYGLSKFDDYLSGLLGYGDTGITPVPSGAGAAMAVSTLLASSGRQGVIHVRPGTTATGYALGYYGATPFYLGGGCCAAEASLTEQALSAAADEYILRFGIHNNITGGAPTDGIYLLYDHLNLGVNLQARNINSVAGGGNTTVDTGVPMPATPNWMKLRVEVNSAALRSDYFVNNALVSGVGGIVTRLPLTTTALKLLNIGMTNSAYTSVIHQANVDYSRIQSYPNTPR